MSARILVVDDLEANRRLLEAKLTGEYYDVLMAQRGEEAVQLAKREKPDLILMDIQLPEVSGLEVTKWLKDDDELCRIPVVAVTAFAMKGDEERIRSGGCEAYVSKPISVMTFLETVRKFIGPSKS